jgi:hypothetical protein
MNRTMILCIALTLVTYRLVRASSVVTKRLLGARAEQIDAAPMQLAGISTRRVSGLRRMVRL